MMRLAAITFLAVLLARAADAPIIRPLPEVTALKFENIRLRIQIAQSEQNVLIEQTCKEAGIPVDRCIIDTAKGQIRENVPEKPPEPPKIPKN